MTSPQPPSWAEGLLTLFVPARLRDGILGDLLEAYRETQLPARGRSGADAWYVRQVLGFVGRACLPWTVLLSSMLIARDLFDIARPTADFHTRAAVLSYALISAFALAGAFAAFRSRRVLSGTVLGLIVALMTCTIVAVYALIDDAFIYPALAGNPAYTALIETADVPIIPIVLLGTLAGSIGGAMATSARLWFRRRDAPLKGRA